MADTEHLLRAALAATAEPEDAGFTDEVSLHLDRMERRRRVVLTVLMIVALLLVGGMIAGLIGSAQVLTRLPMTAGMVVPVAVRDPLLLWASYMAFLGLAVIAFPLVRLRS